MRTDYEDLRAPSDADVYEAEQYVEASRAALDATLMRLQRRVSMQGMTESALDSLRYGDGARYARNLKESVVRNPLPVTFSVLALVWTALAERHPRSEAGNGRGPLHGLKEASEHGAGRLRASAREWMEQGRGGVHTARSRMQQWRGAAAERSRESALQARHFSHEHPLIVAGAGLTLGAVIATLLPPTRMEDRQLGGIRDTMRDELRAGMARKSGDRNEGHQDDERWNKYHRDERAGREAGPQMEATERTPAAGKPPAEAVAYPPRQEALDPEPGRIDVPVGSDQGPETQAPPTPSSPTPGSQDEMRP